MCLLFLNSQNNFPDNISEVQQEKTHMVERDHLLQIAFSSIHAPLPHAQMNNNVQECVFDRLPVKKKRGNCLFFVSGMMLYRVGWP